MDDALCLVLEQALPLEPVRVPLDQAAGCVLAEDVVVRLRLTLTLDVAAFDWCGIYHSRGPPIAHVPTHIHTTRTGDGAPAGVPRLHHGRLRGGGLRRAGCVSLTL